uniref:V-SNARE coiled-coil homology domain-containing protein n=1 Tax=Terrapene triunguis TaxID=2587831 RepID=A0A674K361_9SAUR
LPWFQAPSASSNRLLFLQAVDKVIDIMTVNVDKVLERDQKLSELDDLKRKYWWKNYKVTMTRVFPMQINVTKNYKLLNTT